MSNRLLVEAAPIDSWPGPVSQNTNFLSTRSAVGQSFTGTADSITGAMFLLGLDTAGTVLTGTMYAKLYAESHATAYGTDSIPTGAPLATSDPIPASVVTGVINSSPQGVIFSFSGTQQYTMTAGTKYVIVLEWQASTALWAHGSISGAAGNESLYNSSTGTWTQHTADLVFAVYGTSGSVLLEDGTSYLLLEDPVLIPDSYALSSDTNTSPLTWNHTIGNGTDRMLVVATALQGGTQGTVTAVTYNGVALTKAVGKQNLTGLGGSESTLWLLPNPPQGTYAVSVTATLPTTPDFTGASMSYFNAIQSTIPDATGSGSGATAGTSTAAITTVNTGAWTIGVMNFMNNGSTTGAITSSQTVREAAGMAININGRISVVDSGAAVTAGANTVAYSSTDGTGADSRNYTIAAISLAPVRSVAGTTGTVLTATQPAIARIANTKTLNQPATARIATIPTKLQPAISRISNTRTVTQPAIARVAKNLTKTQPATARIANSGVVKTQSAIARIANNRALTQSAVSRISQTFTKTQPAVSRISRTFTLAQPATAHIAPNVIKTQPAVARISTNPTKTQSAISRISQTFTKAQPAISRISRTSTLTQPANARVARNLTKTQPATARIANSGVVKTQGAVARIATNRALTQSATSRISQTVTKTQPAIARVAKNLTRTQPAIAAIQKNITKTQPGIARIAGTVTRTQPAVSRISRTITRTQLATSRVAKNVTKTQPAVASITVNGITTKTQGAISRIATNRSTTQSAISRIAQRITLTQPAISRISRTSVKTQPAASRISQTLSRTQPATANITAVLIRAKTQPAVSRIATQRTFTQSATARILHYDITITPDVPSTATTWTPDSNGTTTFTAETPTSGAIWVVDSIGTGTVTPDDTVTSVTWTPEG